MKSNIVCLAVCINVESRLAYSFIHSFVRRIRNPFQREVQICSLSNANIAPRPNEMDMWMLGVVVSQSNIRLDDCCVCFGTSIMICKEARTNDLLEITCKSYCVLEMITLRLEQRYRVAVQELRQQN